MATVGGEARSIRRRRYLPSPPWRSIAFGLTAAAGLLAFYLGVIALAQDPAHAVAQLRADLWFVAPVTAGFGMQVGLFVWLRQLHAAARASTTVAAGGTGMGTTAMLACCAHHLNDVLPVLGLSGAAVFLNEWKTPLAALALIMTAGGIVYMAAQVRRAYRACAPMGRAARATA